MPFSNGTEAMLFIHNVCDKGECVNYIYDAATESWGCTITDLHFAYGYGAEGKAKEILDKLCNGEHCSMYKRLREGEGVDPLRMAYGQTRLEASMERTLDRVTGPALRTENTLSDKRFNELPVANFIALPTRSLVCKNCGHEGDGHEFAWWENEAEFKVKFICPKCGTEVE